MSVSFLKVKAKEITKPSVVFKTLKGKGERTEKVRKSPRKSTPKRTIEKSTPKRTIEKSTPKKTIEKSTPKKTIEKLTPKKTIEKSTPKKTIEKSPLKKVQKNPSKTSSDSPQKEAQKNNEELRNSRTRLKTKKSVGSVKSEKNAKNENEKPKIKQKKCPLGHVWLGSTWACPFCLQKLEIFQKNADKNNGKLLSTLYKLPIRYECPFHGEFKVEIFSPTEWCKKCRENEMKTKFSKEDLKYNTAKGLAEKLKNERQKIDQARLDFLREKRGAKEVEPNLTLLEKIEKDWTGFNGRGGDGGNGRKISKELFVTQQILKTRVEILTNFQKIKTLQNFFKEGDSKKLYKRLCLLLHPDKNKEIDKNYFITLTELFKIEK